MTENIDCICPECKGDLSGWPSIEESLYQVFSVNEWLCQLCYEDFVYGTEEE